MAHDKRSRFWASILGQGEKLAVYGMAIGDEPTRMSLGERAIQRKTLGDGTSQFQVEVDVSYSAGTRWASVERDTYSVGSDPIQRGDTVLIRLHGIDYEGDPLLTKFPPVRIQDDQPPDNSVFEVVEKGDDLADDPWID